MERVAGAEGLRDEVREALQRKAAVVTGSERLARTIRHQFDAWMQESGRERWEPPSVLSWSAWTRSLWRRMLVDGRTQVLLLNADQEHAVWRRILAADRETVTLRGLDGLAETAAQAWSGLCAYAAIPRTRSGRARLFDRLEQESGSADTAAFARWARRFDERCQAERLASGAELNSLLTAAARLGDLPFEDGEILLAGLDLLVPAQEQWIDALRSNDVDVRFVRGESAGAKVSLTEANEAEDELRACARWAAGRLAQSSDVRIAVIVPDVSAERAGLERVFREVLAPELESIHTNEGSAPYEFSLGRRLSEVPYIAVALDLLRCAERAMPLERVSSLLVSAYFAADTGEREARAEFDAFDLRAREMLRPEVSLRDLARRVAASRRSQRLPVLGHALRRMTHTADSFDGVSQSYGEWAQGMRSFLRAAGWGAPGGETSHEFQTRERWESALDALSTLDFENHPVDFEEALRTLERIARETVFAPASASAPVQIMGPLEAAGSHFDGLWLLRAGELSWPPVPGTSALLPWTLRRELRMPGTDVEMDFERARQLTERLLRSADEVIVSYAHHAGEVRQRASAVVRSMSNVRETDLSEAAGAQAERTPVATERIEDRGEPLAVPERTTTGGVRVLELQAACGFRAFAEQRLWSTALDHQSLGLSSRESGTVIHRVLQSFWDEIRTQARLRPMTYEERDAALLRAVDHGLVRAQAMTSGAWDLSYLAVQRERLRRLLHHWLEVELARPPFEVIESEKEHRDVRVGPLRLKVRVDRVDVVDEARVLIDYKTGSADLKSWTGDRPDAPQVPLYAILAAEDGAMSTSASSETEGAVSADLGAVAFARVKAGSEASLRGFATRAGLLPGKLPRMDAGTFEGQVELWRVVLEGIAEDFAAGDARVRPKNYPATCKHCSQRILCRLDASLLDEIEEEEQRGSEDG